MRETKQHTIDGFTYSISQLGGKLGKKVLAHLMRVVSPAFEAENPASAFAGALTDDELDYLCDNFAKCTEFSAEDTPDKVLNLADQFDNHFAGRYGAMVKWLWAAVDTNYATFFAELGLTPEVRAQLIQGIKAEMSAMTTSSPTGSSGAASLRASTPSGT